MRSSKPRKRKYVLQMTASQRKLVQAWLDGGERAPVMTNWRECQTLRAAEAAMKRDKERSQSLRKEYLDKLEKETPVHDRTKLKQPNLLCRLWRDVGDVLQVSLKPRKAQEMLELREEDALAEAKLQQVVIDQCNGGWKTQETPSQTPTSAKPARKRRASSTTRRK